MVKNLLKKRNFIFLILILTSISLNTVAQTIKNSTSLQTRKKPNHSLNRVSKSNKTHKRQEKSTLPPIKSNDPIEPEFDFSLIPNNEFSQPISDETNSRNSLGIDPVYSINVTSVLGQNALLQCAVRNIGSFKILWLRVRDGDVLAFDNMLISQDTRFSLIKNSINESNLFIQGVRSDDAGEYVCQINSQSLKAKLVNLIILTPPTFSEVEIKHEVSSPHYAHLALAAAISANGNHNKHNNHLHHNNNNHNQHNSAQSSTKSINVIEGKQLELECFAFGQPKPIINWYVKRYKSENLTEYLLNSNKILVKNVLRKQYEYFECEATNQVPPSVSKKFKINVMYAPEMSISPTKVYVNSPPVQVKFNCSVNSYPESDIIWIYSSSLKDGIFKNGSKKRQTLYSTRSNQKHFTHFTRKDRKSRSSLFNPTRSVSNELNLEQFDSNLILNSKMKYNVYLQSINETFKQSSIVISIENENDFGIYACYANNSIGSKSVKFYIYGDQTKKLVNNLTTQIGFQNSFIQSTTTTTATASSLLQSTTNILLSSTTVPQIVSTIRDLNLKESNVRSNIKQKSLDNNNHEIDLSFNRNIKNEPDGDDDGVSSSGGGGDAGGSGGNGGGDFIIDEKLIQEKLNSDALYNIDSSTPIGGYFNRHETTDLSKLADLDKPVSTSLFNLFFGSSQKSSSISIFILNRNFSYSNYLYVLSFYIFKILVINYIIYY